MNVEIQIRVFFVYKLKLDESEMKDNLLCGEHKRRDAKCLLQAVSTVVELSALVFHDSTVPRTAFANYHGAETCLHTHDSHVLLLR